jgi:hypothetical protein
MQADLDVELREVEPAVSPLEVLRNAGHGRCDELLGLLSRRSTIGLPGRRKPESNPPEDVGFGLASKHVQGGWVAVHEAHPVHEKDGVLGRLEQRVE